MTQLDLTNLKAQHPLPAAMQRDGIKLVRSSGHFACLCPFHVERTPSCHVWEDHFHCFGCNERGDIFDYIQKTRSINFTEALRVLGGFISPDTTLIRKPKEETPRPEPRDFNPRTTWERCWHDTKEEQVIAHGHRLGVNPECLFWIGIVWNRSLSTWLFPMYDGQKQMIGLRTRNENGEKRAVTGSRNGLFIPTEVPPDSRLYVCEGPTDTAAALSMGFYAIGRASCNSCVEMVLEFLKCHRTIREVVVCSDNDSPGLKGAEALREKLPLKSWLLLLPLKDIRRFCQVGGERTMIEAMISSQTPRVTRPA